MAKRIRVGVVFGGRSGEHQVSINSALSILRELDRETYAAVPIFLDRQGQWCDHRFSQTVVKLAGQGVFRDDTPADSVVTPWVRLREVDIVFPIVHGTYGEDGCLQGLLEMTDLPYVGPGVASSAVGMDKVLMKDIWAAHKLPQPEWAVAYRWQVEEDLQGMLDRLLQHPGLPCFVKPANMGSSVGISKAKTREELEDALRTAAAFDRKILVEASVETSREFNLGVLGNRNPQVSVVGEIVAESVAWLDYEAKYGSSGGVRTQIPAELDATVVERLRNLAVRAYQTLDTCGLARVDFLMDSGGQLYLNEINTLPGFTNVSMYPRLWAATGLAYPNLLSKVVELGFEQYRERRASRTEHKA